MPDASDAIRARRAPQALLPATVNAEARTVEVIWTTGADVTRTDFLTGERYVERLALAPESVDLTRLNAGASVLNTHKTGDVADVIGSVKRAWLTNGEGRAIIRISRRDDVEPIWQDIRDGTLRHISVGYNVQSWSVERRDGQPDIWTATRWTPMEISFVPVPADAGAGTRSLQSTRQKMEDLEADTTEPRSRSAVLAERSRVNRISRCVDVLGISKADADAAISDGTSADAFVERAMAEAQARTAVIRTGIDFRVTRDEGETRGGALADAIYCRLSGKTPTGPAVEYQGKRLVEIARAGLEAAGVRGAHRMSDDEILSFRSGGQHTTSDFPTLLTAAGNRTFSGFYEAAQSPLKTVARPSTLPDFRPMKRVRLKEGPQLLEVIEGGPVEFGSSDEEFEQISLRTFARRFALSRQAIINDDLQAFADMIRFWAMAAADLEARVLIAVLDANSKTGATLADGNPVFHTAHGNKAASGGAISVTTLSAGRLALRSQKGIGGEIFVNAPAKFLLVGSANETTGEQFLAQLAPVASSEVNPFAGKLQLLVEPRITDNRWYLFCDPTMLPVLEYANLSSAPGPQLASKDSWDVLGMEYRLVHDFGAAAIDWRGAFLNPGT